MNLANKLTLLRVVIVPFFVLFMCFGAIPLNYFWALFLFGAASFTDMFDGKVARKYDMVTDFGKFLDPLADKILVAAALVCFAELVSDNLGLIPALPVQIIGDVLMYIAALLTVISGVKYLYDYREFIDPTK